MELVSDPVTHQDGNVFVEDREKETDHVIEVQVPRKVVEMTEATR